MLRTCSRVIALVAMVACLSMTAQAADESGQYKIRPLDPNNAADQQEIIRWLDPSGTADRDELIRTAIDVDKRFKATNRDIKAAGRSPTALKAEITKRLQNFVRDEGAIVSIAVTDVNSYRFTVSGQVEKPGIQTSNRW